MRKRKINIIGAGNVAWHLSQCLAKNCEIVNIYSRNTENSEELANLIGAKHITKLANLETVDLNIVSVSDDAIQKISLELPKNVPVCHTSGSISLDVFEGYENAGILYPLQTFSKGRDVELSIVPFLFEASNNQMKALLEKIIKENFKASSQYCDSVSRRKIHLAAVIACNFTSLMLKYSEGILIDDNRTLDLLRPLLEETIAKNFELGPERSMTGPAKRKDMVVLEMQKRLIEDEELKEIYTLLSQAIMKA